MLNQIVELGREEPQPPYEAGPARLTVEGTALSGTVARPELRTSQGEQTRNHSICFGT